MLNYLLMLGLITSNMPPVCQQVLLVDKPALLPTRSTSWTSGMLQMDNTAKMNLLSLDAASLGLIMPGQARIGLAAAGGW